MASARGEGKKRQSYSPAVEVLEALRLLSNVTQTLPDIAVPHDLLTPTSPLEAPVPSPVSGTAWDTALDQTRLAELPGQPSDGADSQAISSGIAQLNRYLSRAWYRAGIPAQMHNDCSQTVYMTLLQNLGRPQFDSLVAEIGHAGIRDVLSRETTEGPDFFRAIDTVKKRAQRHSFQPLDTIDVAASPQEDETQLQRRGAPRGDCAVAQPWRGRPDPRHPERGDARRDRRAVGRRPEDRQQREDPGDPEAPDRSQHRRPRLRDCQESPPFSSLTASRVDGWGPTSPAPIRADDFENCSSRKKRPRPSAAHHAG